ncbi:unnamed protein product [Parascedosporium putredinis]|uniref:Major facilitator superfamily (MFS) profile domain-containing protein n=1 Tax=Parascedosporium putredinis TaxID=1442378 RepID=A0A9P1MEL4_9PEZI|nr:unnamed protein product [Parascedosporium putredinis]CAI8001785.1 unnamed protein product [Parascedosporium putredinis]
MAASGSNTCVLELSDYSEVHASAAPAQDRKSPASRSLASRPRTPDEVESGGSEPNGGNVAMVVEKWNSPQINAYRVPATFWSLLVMGANDAAYGALIPYLEKYYGLNYTIVSLVFLSPFVGYVASAILNNYLHLTIGQRGIGIICGTCHTLAYIIICLHPLMPSSSSLLSLPASETGSLGLAVIELVVLTWAFWDCNAETYRRLYHGEHGTENKTGLKDALLKMPAARVSWLCAAFLLVYVGVEVALGGWIVTFMIQVRNGQAFASGMTATGFWLGITVGRAILGFVTPLFGVKLAMTIYIAITMGLELLFWLVPNFYVSAVAVSFQGFFLGPLFPGVVLVASAILPRHLHVVVIGFAAAFGGCGAAVLPFAVGAIAQVKGVQVLQPIILALLTVLLILWLCLPRINKKRE